ncbi:hypothetical protein WOLCODRAFT_99912 [Wolfiporia cocos MD-104 SS10]|uniref:C2H2-type domain-containing protein n=1 Tax=Wolfiporia cocos (strain MD-104) TaxID=742152 RepID=A0A2H3JG21_WOLCO|nr:hypothetical protein WOLCODRAFT_99912 [Wolfiporia cocos MD-104 SS10]
MDISLAQDPLRALLDIYSPPLRSDGTSEPLVGIFADINMREAAAMCELPTFGVNPADVMGDEPNVKAKSPEPDELGRLLLSLSPDFDICDDTQHTSATEAQFPDDAINVIVSVLSASKREEDVQQLEAALEQRSTPPPRRPDPFLFSQNLSTQPPMPPSAPPTAMEQPISFVIPNLLMVPKLDQAPLVDVFAPPAEQPSFPVLDPPPVIVRHQSPVLNAHLGIELEDLRRRAEDFRRRNPGLDIDKTWLQAYAGRLSQRGELLDDYRCYVNGCSQRNKRRDHILVHVGSHVEHRPFQCNVCGMRFLRKNECKRHESSHGGHKPFSCPICAPYQERSFVRQDLLKRHMRVTHGIQGDPSNDRRKRMRFSRGEDVYWP